MAHTSNCRCEADSGRTVQSSRPQLLARSLGANTIGLQFAAATAAAVVVVVRLSVSILARLCLSVCLSVSLLPCHHVSCDVRHAHSCSDATTTHCTVASCCCCCCCRCVLVARQPASSFDYVYGTSFSVAESHINIYMTPVSAIMSLNHE